MAKLAGATVSVSVALAVVPLLSVTRKVTLQEVHDVVGVPFNWPLPAPSAIPSNEPDVSSQA
jgi:hypothetical protein